MKKQAGFTLVEVLAATAIAGVIMTGAFMVLEQMVWGGGRNANLTQMYTDLDRATYFIRKDCQMAQNTSLPEDGTPQSSANFTWSDYSQLASGNFTHYSNYFTSNTTLIRNYDGEESIIGRHIESITFSKDDKFINVSITAESPDSRTLDRTISFQSYIRAEEPE